MRSRVRSDFVGGTRPMMAPHRRPRHENEFEADPLLARLGLARSGRASLRAAGGGRGRRPAARARADEFAACTPSERAGCRQEDTRMTTLSVGTDKGLFRFERTAAGWRQDGDVGFLGWRVTALGRSPGGRHL